MHYAFMHVEYYLSILKFEKKVSFSAKSSDNPLTKIFFNDNAKEFSTEEQNEFIEMM